MASLIRYESCSIREPKKVLTVGHKKCPSQKCQEGKPFINKLNSTRKDGIFFGDLQWFGIRGLASHTNANKAILLLKSFMERK